MHPTEIIQQDHTLCQRVAVGKQKFSQAVAVVDEVDSAAAIKAAASKIGDELNLRSALPDLVKVVVVEAVKEKLFAALRAEFITGPENELAAFRKLHADTLKNYGGIV